MLIKAYKVIFFNINICFFIKIFNCNIIGTRRTIFKQFIDIYELTQCIFYCNCNIWWPLFIFIMGNNDWKFHCWCQNSLHIFNSSNEVSLKKLFLLNILFFNKNVKFKISKSKNNNNLKFFKIKKR